MATGRDVETASRDWKAEGVSPANQPCAAMIPLARAMPLPSPAWGTGAIPVSAAPFPPPDSRNDFLGAFRLICQAGISNARLAEMIKYDDPIVYPGQPGKSHLHQFFGNTLADANSTYDSLRKTGESSCANALNRSAYWMPAMLDGKGFVVPPDYVQIYYKRRPKTDPECTIAGKGCVDLPRGLRYIFGANMLDMAAIKTGGGHFNCQGTGAVSGWYRSITDAAKFCPIGSQLEAIISSPECWNGKDLDSADHRSHVSYMVSDPNTAKRSCPATHPYIIAQFTMGAFYTTDATLDRSGVWDGTFNSWHLSSDNMPGMPMKPGTSFHADWWGGWNEQVLATWHANCIDGLKNASGADLCNGTQLKQAYPDNWGPRPRVPVPVRP
jgi:hypothetical protein